MEKTVLITGSTKGIGFETARQLLEKGLRVIVSGRNEGKLADAADRLKKEKGQVETLLMDVNHGVFVNKAAQQFAVKKIRIDVLINNAAVLLKNDHSLSEQNEQILEETFQTNVYGPIRVIHAFLPYMNSSSRIINISSGGGSMTDPVGGWSPAYCLSKTALNGLTRQLAFDLSNRKISVNAVCPGWVKTDMGGKSAPRSVEKGAETPVWLATEADQTLTGKFFRDKAEIDW